jgi:hypothetical protein
MVSGYFFSVVSFMSLSRDAPSSIVFTVYNASFAVILTTRV